MIYWNNEINSFNLFPSGWDKRSGLVPETFHQISWRLLIVIVNVNELVLDYCGFLDADIDGDVFITINVIDVAYRFE